MPVVRLLPVERGGLDADRFARQAKCPRWCVGNGDFGNPDRVRVKTDFVNRIKVIWVVQLAREK
jgi:hypothetical protein